MTDNFIGSTFGIDGHLIVIGWSGEKIGSNKKYTVHCKVCALDCELNGLANYLITRDKLQSGQIPCGCSKRHSWSKDQYEIILKRALVDGFCFTEWFGDYLGNKSKIVISCPEHGVLAPKTVSDILSGRRCIECRRDKVKKALTKSDDEWVEEFMLTGAYPEGSRFWRSDKRVDHPRYRNGRAGFWNHYCSRCHETVEAWCSELKDGTLSCACGRERQLYAYVHSLKQDGVEVAIKFGIASSYNRRFRQQSKLSLFEMEILGVWKFPSVVDCKRAEKEVKNSLNTKVVNKEMLPDGWTETCDYVEVEKVMKIYTNNKGVRIK